MEGDAHPLSLTVSIVELLLSVAVHIAVKIIERAGIGERLMAEVLKFSTFALLRGIYGRIDRILELMNDRIVEVKDRLAEVGSRIDETNGQIDAMRGRAEPMHQRGGRIDSVYRVLRDL